MTRTKLALSLVALLVLGFLSGWLFYSWLPGAVSTSPVRPGAPAGASAAPSRAGFCCTTVGSACDQVSDPGLCFRAGGRAFNAVQANCDYYCLNVKP